jgi:hypothetical protein
MIQIFKNYLEKLTKKHVEEEIVEEESLVPNVSGSIRLEFDAETGDFGVMVNVEDLSDSCVEIFSLLMVHMANGEIVPFVYESLVGWADDDEEKKDFNEKVGEKIIGFTSDIIKEKASQKNSTAIRASEVFNYRKKD